MKPSLVEHKLIAGLAIACVLCTWAIGEAMIVRSTRHADGEPGLSVQDLKVRFTANATSLLQAQAQGPMRGYFADARELNLVTRWARAGADRAMYERDVADVLEQRCAACHSAGGEAAFRRLDSFEDAREAAMAPPAPSLGKQLLVTKVHVVGIGLLLGVAAFLFQATGTRWRLKQIVPLAAFAGLAIDFGGWWAMRLSLDFAICRVVGNMLMSIGLLLMCARVLLALFREAR